MLHRKQVHETLSLYANLYYRFRNITGLHIYTLLKYLQQTLLNAFARKQYIK